MNFCYMDDVCGEEFKPEEFENAQYVVDRKMNGKPYKDPDSKSKKLYEDWKKFLCKKLSIQEEDIEVYEEKNPYEKEETFYEIKWKDFRLGSDYIGPSTTIMHSKGFSNLEAGIAIKRGRIFGGHIIWPRIGLSSINPRRATSFKDRIDATLLDLKNWYEGKPCSMQDVFDDNASWLRPHSNFNFADFVERFALEDFVDQDTLMPYDLSTYDDKMKRYKDTLKSIPNRALTNDKTYYTHYTEGNLHAIECREERIRNIMEDDENGTI